MFPSDPQKPVETEYASPILDSIDRSIREHLCDLRSGLAFSNQLSEKIFFLDRPLRPCFCMFPFQRLFLFV